MNRYRKITAKLIHDLVKSVKAFPLILMSFGTDPTLKS